ncbi:MAG: hypothetical protein ABI977_21790 [Acidobacteriota bacterium]
MAMLEQRLAARKQAADRMPDGVGDLFEMPLAHYLALSDEVRDAITLRAYQTLHSWIEKELEKRRAEWLLVCGGEILESSPTLTNYPSDDKLMQIGQERDRIPFVFVRSPLIEESHWSMIEPTDFYPTIPLTIAAAGTEIEQISAKGIEVTADFDSGSPRMLVNYELMSFHQIIHRQPVNIAHSGSHLGQWYRYHILPILISERKEDGDFITRELAALCIRNWRLSPLCRINPNREALAGRNLLLEFPLRLELTGAERVTRVAPA